MEDSKILQMHEEMKEDEQKQKKSILEHMPQNTKLIFLGAVGILIWAMYTGRIEKNSGLVLLLVIGAIVYFSTSTGAGRELTEQECTVSLYNQLRFKQLHPLGQEYQIPPRAKIRIRPLGKAHHLSGRQWKRVLGVEIYNPHMYRTDYYRAEINVHTGDLIEMEYLPGGFSELDLKEIIVVDSPYLWKERKYHERTGRYYDGKK